MKDKASNPALWSLCEASAAIAAGELSSVELTSACLSRIEEWQPVLNAFLAIEAEEALEAARERDTERARGFIRGPLHGIPLAHKDVFLRNDKPVTAASGVLRDFVGDTDATAYARTVEAGAVTLGSLNLSEFCAGPSGANQFYGDCRNPWNLEHIPGGSSSGSCAAVATRLVCGSLGSDTGGSVRVPSAYCGVVGLRPTYGHVSRYGVIPRSWTADCIGPIARTVADVAQLLSVIAGYDPKDGTSVKRDRRDYSLAIGSSVRGMRIGVPDESYFAGCTPSVRAAIDQAIQIFKEAGAVAVPVTMPDMTMHYRLADLILRCEGSAMHEKWLHERPEDYSVHARTRLDTGYYIPATHYIQAMSLRAPMAKQFVSDVMTGIDALMAPVTADTAPPYEAMRDHVSGTVANTIAKSAFYTRPYSYLGLPAISIPSGFSDGLPTSFALVGHPFGEDRLLALGSAYQATTDWHTAVPGGPA